MCFIAAHRLVDSRTHPFPAGSLLDKAAKLWRKKQARRCAKHGQHSTVALDNVQWLRALKIRSSASWAPTPSFAPRLSCILNRAALVSPPPAPPVCRQRALEKKLQREQQRIRRMEAADAAARGDTRKGAAEPRKEAEPQSPPSDDEDEGGIDEDDLIASTAGVEAAAPPAGVQQQQGQQPPGFAPPSVLASASLGLSRAAVVVQRALHAAAVRAPPRRCLTRPQRAAQ